MPVGVSARHQAIAVMLDFMKSVCVPLVRVHCPACWALQWAGSHPRHGILTLDAGGAIPRRTSPPTNSLPPSGFWVIDIFAPRK